MERKRAILENEAKEMGRKKKVGYTANFLVIMEMTFIHAMKIF